MDINKNSYVLGFAVVVTSAVSALLAVLSAALKPTQEAAKEFDRQKNIMLAAGLLQDGDTRPRAEIEKVFETRFKPHVVELQSGAMVDDKYTPATLKAVKDAAERGRYRDVYEAVDEAGKTSAWVLPVSGKGLWSILYGFLALDASGRTVKGITFYEHGETPGLGGEVENPEWRAKWPGKTIYDDQGDLVSVKVKKGKVDPNVAAERAHYVDGLSGATITSNGVTALVKKDLTAFQPFLERIRQ
ncbi:MAG: NADH:ubiquinone reductase (Na(+)-transporting) subunit C [Planctomycetota bacterium]